MLIVFSPKASAEPQNLCTNGGFEESGSNNIPVGWNGFASSGGSFGISKDSFNGKNSLFLKSPSDAVVGINRTQDALIPIVRGIARFQYKAISSEKEGKNLQVCIIAMDEDGRNEVGRKIFTVPSEHVGDGKWHLAEFEFYFSVRDDAKSVHFAPRINETTSEKGAGELLIDDVYIGFLGPRLKIEKFGVEKPIVNIGETTTIRALITNIGDQVPSNAGVTLKLPEGISLVGKQEEYSSINALEPDKSISLSWQIRADKALSSPVEIILDPSNSSTVYLTATSIDNLAEPELSLENEYISLNFYKTELGYGIFTISPAKTALPLAQTSMLSSLVYRTGREIKHVPIFADEVQKWEHALIFSSRFTDADGVKWNFSFRFELPSKQKWVDVSYKAETDKDRELLAFYGPVLYSDHAKRYDAVFPGLEYLEKDEISSSTLDIAPPNHIRRVPHPNKVTIPLMGISQSHEDGSIVGMMWDSKKNWSASADRPSALFASPNWFEFMDNRDVMGIFVPSAPEWVDENHTYASKPYILKSYEILEIEFQLFAIHSPDTEISSIYAIPYWIEKYGLPEPLSLPRGTLARELEFSLNAYMDTLWVEDEQAWHNTLDWDPWGIRVNSEFARYLWLSAKILADSPKKAGYLQRAELAFNKLGDNLGRELPFYIGRLDVIYPRIKGMVNGLLQSQREDGSWRFDPDVWNANDTIQHLDYHKLGKKDDVEIGLCANNARNLLLYASMTGDKASLDAGLKALDFMRRFKIPRAAQVWEVPVHTPDILASAHAVGAYLEAYKLTEKKEYLDSAIYWAYTGLPFVYLWKNSDMPYMLYASIPVFGATWFTGSWFGAAVQWNGLDYAYSLFDLARYDSSFPWRKIAEGLTISGLYQQETGEKYKGLYPDSYNLVDKSSSAWKLAPSQIVRNLFVMMGYPAEPTAKIIRKGDAKAHVTAAVKVRDARMTDEALSFSLDYPDDMNGYIMIAGIDKPGKDSVKSNDLVINEADDLGSSAQCWKYDNWNGMLFLKLKSGKAMITISNPIPKYTQQITDVLMKIEWNFAQTESRDWSADSDLEQLGIKDGALISRSTGSDPYMVSAPTKIDSGKYSQIMIRMKTTRGNNAQLFWSTDTSPINEENSIHFGIKSDGEFHDYIINVSQHKNWKGRITSLRLDPTDAIGSEIAIESIIGR